MTPAARLQAAIEILDLIVVSARDNGPAADTIIASWFKTRRFAGSKDRRAVREHIYTAIRAFGDPPSSGRAAFAALQDFHPLFDGSPHGPAPLAPDEVQAQPGVIPAWLHKRIADGDQAALLGRAPFDLRANALRGSRDMLLAKLPNSLAIAGTRHGLRLPENIPLEQHPELAGLVEVQDAGSQMIAEACQALPGELIIDLCAGAGGKTLALAADMANQGRIVACDTDRRRLGNLGPRAEIAGASNIETRLLNPKREREALADLENAADCVLVDAPCSGTGTWRRNPELRWRVTPARLNALCVLQSHVLDVAADLARPGGRLVYAVCSMLEEEGARQIARFLARHSGWSAKTISTGLGSPSGQGVQLSPAMDGSDGFFFARLAKA